MSFVGVGFSLMVATTDPIIRMHRVLYNFP